MRHMSAAIGLAGILLVGGCSAADESDRGGGQPSDTERSAGGAVVSAGFRGPSGNPVGTVQFTEAAGQVEVQARLAGLMPGRYRLAVHEFGKCEAGRDSSSGDFQSAGDRLDRAGASPQAGSHWPFDVLADGTGTLATATDSFTLADLRNDGLGRAVVIELAFDPYAGATQIPETRAFEVGTRIACALVGVRATS